MTAIQEPTPTSIQNIDANPQISAPSQSQSKFHDFSITAEQSKLLQKFLPPGFSLIQVKVPRGPTKRGSGGLGALDGSKVWTGIPDKSKREAHTKAEKKIKEPVEFYRRCETILGFLKKHKNGYPFLEPVDPEVLGIPDYFTIIKEPMDFSKVDKRLKSGFYKSFGEFENDIHKIWDNALTYNKPDTQIYHMTTEISNYFQRILNEEDPSTVHTSSKTSSGNKGSKRVNEGSFNVDFHNRPGRPSNGQKIISIKPLSYQEKKNLSEMIRELPGESLWEVWKIISPDNENHDEELEFDIETLEPEKARRLEEYVKSKLNNSNPKKKQSKNQSAPRETTAPSNVGTKVQPPSYQNGSTPLNPAAPAYRAAQDPAPVAPRETAQNEVNNSESSFISDLSDSDEE